VSEADEGLLQLDGHCLDLGGADLDQYRVSDEEYRERGGMSLKEALPFGNRDRLAWILRSLTSIPPGTRLLDVGCGAQPYRMFCRHLDYCGQDAALYDGHGDGRGVQRPDFRADPDIRSDITAIPIQDSSFGAVLCVSVLEHVPDPVAALAELARVLQPGGTLLITAPFSGVTHFAPYHFAVGFNRYFYEHHLPALGFDIVEMKPNGGYFAYLLSMLSQLPEFAERYAHRSLRGWDRAALNRLAATLRDLDDDDRDSGELLNYGWQVRAVRA
jgi:SAM-dependent methyltransferase